MPNYSKQIIAYFKWTVESIEKINFAFTTAFAYVSNWTKIHLFADTLIIKSIYYLLYNISIHMLICPTTILFYWEFFNNNFVF